MNRFCSHEILRQVRRCEQQLRKRDFCLTQCYGAGISAAAVFLLLPFHLSRVGAALIILALAYMIFQVYAAHRNRPADADIQGLGAGAVELSRIYARVAVARSAFYNLPFLVGSNLVFMGLPVGTDPVRKAAMDCAFLTGTVVAFLVCYWLNQLAIRRELQPIQDRFLVRVGDNQPPHEY